MTLHTASGEEFDSTALAQVRKNQEDMIKYGKLADSLEAAGDINELINALGELRKIKTNYSTDLSGAHELGFKLEKLIEQYPSLVNAKEQAPKIYNNNGWVLIEQGRYPEAVTYFNKSIEGHL